MCAPVEKKIWAPEPIARVIQHAHGVYRYRVFYGGRGSGKSYSVALAAAILGATRKMRILCTRDIQSSIAESMMQEIKNAIDAHEFLSSFYRVGRNIQGVNGTEFLFHGLRHNIGSIKSLAKIDLCIVEEAEDVMHHSWQELLPTIRAPQSEIWIIFNPRSRTSWVARNFLENPPPKRTALAKVNIDANAKAPDVLREQMRQDRERMSPALYAHVWEGEYYEHTDAQIFLNKWRVAEFEPAKLWDGPYYGLDFGTVDPTACVEVWIHDDTLYIYRDFSRTGVEIDAIADVLLETFPKIADYTIRADSSRPDTISYLARNGLKVIGEAKLKIEEGIAHMRAYREIVAHPRCKATIDELRLYSYRVDRLSGDVTPDIIDAHNHCIDAIRYALRPMIRAQGSFYTKRRR